MLLIGSNGTGKSTLAEILIHPEEYLYDGKIVRDESCRIGYASQFSVGDKFQDRTVFEFLSERFTSLQKDIEAVCAAMTETEDLDALYEQYQRFWIKMKPWTGIITKARSENRWQWPG